MTTHPSSSTDTRLPAPDLRPQEVAHILGVSTDTLYNWRKSSAGPPWVRRGNAIFYSRTGLEEWQNAQHEHHDQTQANFRPKDVATILSINQSTLTKWRSTGTGPPWITVGHTIVYPKDDFHHWFNTLRNRTAVQQALHVLSTTPLDDADRDKLRDILSHRD